MAGRLGYQPTLDGLRGLAVLLILVHHVDELTGTAPLARSAFLGVDLFFVLSGFLITSLILDRRSTDRGLWPFYRRRALRLLPAVVFLVAVILAAVAIFDPAATAQQLRGSALVLTYFMNWFIAYGDVAPATLGHLWSLAIEEQFYVVWPAVLVMLLARGVSHRRIAAGVGMAVVAVAIWRVVYGAGGAQELAAIYYRTDTRADALLVGCLVGLLRPSLRHIRRDIVSAIGSFAAATYLLACFAISYRALYFGGFTVVAVTCAVMVLVAVDGRWSLSPVLTSAPLMWLGRLSYSLYLWQIPVVVAVREWAPPSAALRLVVGATSTALLAWVSYRYVEQPFLRWKARLDAPEAAQEALQPAAAV